MPRVTAAVRIRDQHGAIFVLGMFLLVLFFAIGALIVDLLRVERAARSLQRAADAAALAGASQLLRTWDNTDGTELAWKRAKRASIAALRVNPVFGDESGISVPGNFGTQSGYEDSWFDAGTDYRFSTYHFTDPGLQISIERVFYFRPIPPPDDPPREYLLEGRQFCMSVPPNPIPPSGMPGACCAAGMLAYQSANAVRVSLTLENLPLLFGKMVGLQAMSGITRTALGAPDIPPSTATNLDDCV